MRFNIVVAALGAAVTFAGPAAAATFSDLGPDFTYGTLAGGGLTPYTFHAAGSSQCLTLAGDCYTGSDTYAIIAKSSVAGELLVHPGPGAGGNSAVGYTAPTAGLYTLSALGTSYDVGTKNVGFFSIIGGVLSTFTSGTVSGGAADPTGGGTPGTSQAIGATLALAAGDTLGIFVDNFNGDYTGDTTHFSGGVAAVPEPATWAMMIGGLGLTGGALRRRRTATRVTFA